MPSASTAQTYTVSPARLPYDGTLSQGSARAGSISAAALVGVGATAALDRDVDEGGIGDAAVAVMVGDLLGLHEQVDVVGAQVVQPPRS